MNCKLNLTYSSTGRRARDPVIAALMGQALARPNLLSLAAGFTDNRMLPLDIVQEAAAHLARNGTEQLQYGTNVGRPGLRRAIVDILRNQPGEAGLDIEPAQVAITNGSQQALYLLTQVLCDPGDIVLVEAPSYFVFLELLAGLGVRAVSMPMRDDGQIDVPGLRTLIAHLRRTGEWDRVRFAYTIGWFSNPSGRCMDEDVKRDLGALLRALAPSLPILEDAAYRQLHYAAPHAAPSMLALPEYAGLPVVYLGTFSKPLSSGLKVGYVATPHAGLLENLMRVKAHHDFGTANYAQAIIEYILVNGLWEPYLERVRAHYGRKAQVLHDALEEGGLHTLGWRWERPAGGLLMWVRGPDGVDTRTGGAFCNACLERDVLYVPGDLCFAGGAQHNCVRLSIGTLDTPALREAALRFCAAAHSTRP